MLKEATKPEVDLTMPTPTGYKILIAMIEKDKATKGGVILPDALQARETTASIVGMVVSMGPSAYNSKERFPDGPYCKEGDFVIFRSYSGTRMRVGDQEFRLINDDTVEAVVDDPRGIERAI